MCSVVVESWYERQYTCLVVKRRTAAGSPATSTIIVSPRGAIDGKVQSVCSVVVESWYERQQYTCCLVVKRRTAAGFGTSH